VSASLSCLSTLFQWELLAVVNCKSCFMLYADISSLTVDEKKLVLHSVERNGK